TYHNRYSTYDFIRGQEGDPWKGRVGDIDDLLPESGAIGRHKLAESSERFSRQDLINRTVWQHDDAQRPVNRTFIGGLEFIRDNAGEDNWLLQIETFDPHEPFDAPDWARDLAAEHFDGYDGPHYDWPVYNYADEQATPEQIEHLRQNYMALLAACDAQLGRVLRAFDQLDHWKDTALIVCTDHGFFLGERNFVGKMWVPWWEPLARTPLFVHDPRVPSADGQRRSALVQPMLDIGPTLCDMFGQDASALLPHATGRSLRPVLEDDTPIRTTAMFGTFGQQANVTDGRHVYMRAANGERPPEYTLMPTQMRQRFDPAKFANDQVRMAGPFDFTQDAQVMRIPDSVILGGTPGHPDRQRTRLYDLQQDPTQSQSIDDPAIEQRMEQHLVDLMRECDAPTEQYDRFGLRR
ncbi:MAG: sulfatase-like hydrolase/transferase, partial [Planctomycetota bacterium]